MHHVTVTPPRRDLKMLRTPLLLPNLFNYNRANWLYTGTNI